MSVFRFLTSLPSAAESLLANSSASDARADAKTLQGVSANDAYIKALREFSADAWKRAT